MSKIRCKFRIGDLFPYTIYVDSLATVKDGFWVNEDGEITNGSDIKTYIMPHNIIELSKVDDK